MLTAALLIVPVAASGCASCGEPRTAPATSATAAPGSGARAASQAPAGQAFAQLERRFGAQLGVYVLDTGSGRTVTYRADTRFAYCSTSKALSTGVLLKRDSSAQLDQVIRYRSGDLVDYSPITSRHVRSGMTLRAVVAAAVDYSDNTAANLLLNQLGGPHGLQVALRGLGDTNDGRQPDGAIPQRRLPRRHAGYRDRPRHRTGSTSSSRTWRRPAARPARSSGWRGAGPAAAGRRGGEGGRGYSMIDGTLGRADY